MTADVRVMVRVNLLVDVLVSMLVGSVPHTSPDTPQEVEKAKGDQKPSGQVSSEGLNRLQFEDNNAEEAPNETENDRSHDVANSAQERDDRGPSAAPASCLGHRNERKVVVWSEDRVYEPNAGCSTCKNERFIRHGVSPVSCLAQRPNSLALQFRFLFCKFLFILNSL